MATPTTPTDDPNPDVEAWTFTLSCPPSATIVLDNNNGGNDDNNNNNNITVQQQQQSGWKVVSLQQVQPPHPLAAAATTTTRRTTTTSTTTTATDTTTAAATSSTTTTTDNNAERVALLRRGNQEDNDNDDNNHHTNDPDTGWTLSSPYVSFRSHILLQLTYRPAWQAIPEYTTANMSSSCCCRPWCNNDDKETAVDYYTQTWTTADIVAVRVVSSSLSSSSSSAFTLPGGVGECRGLRVQLSPLDDSHVPAVPVALQDAWQRHEARIRQAQRDNASFQYTPHDIVNDDQNEENTTTNRNTNASSGPVLWFALPLAQVDPPILWRVSNIATTDKDKPLAIETITMANGDVTTHHYDHHDDHQQQQQQQQESTHIFINGYQSWSFTGSLVKGHKQPQPALPATLSKAFNFGGAPPPSTAQEVMSSKNSTAAAAALSRHQPKMVYTSDFFTCLSTDGPSSRRQQQQQQQQQREVKFPFINLDERGGTAVIAGWLSQRHQFGVVQVDADLRHVQMHASAHGQIVLPNLRQATNKSLFSLTTDWAHVQLLSPHSYDEEPLVHFFHAVAGYNAARPLQNGNLLVGWCSWYHYYENISARSLRDNFAKLAGLRSKVPMNVSVVDDGYMTAWGDWDSLKPTKFEASSLASVAMDIVQNHMRPGLWLAPFAADKHSKIARLHPDWIIRNQAGLAANSSNCGKFFYGLDATNPAVRQHVSTAVSRAVQDWKFNVLKIDFLYAACLHGNGKYDLGTSRAQAMHMALETIRQAAGANTFLIGCGCPVASAVGFVDGMRVSADTGPTWYPAFPLPWWDHGTLPCLRSMIRNSMSRAPMGHRWWHNDPDCLLLGESTRLTIPEVASAASIVAMTCGMMLLSDDLTKVSVERMRILCKIFPMAGATAVVLDLHSTNDGLPSLLRLWATDRYSSMLESFRENHFRDQTLQTDSVSNLEHVEATFFARQASFQLDAEVPRQPNERKRSCIHVCKGLGTWTIVSISNWSDKPAVLYVPPPALLPPPPTVFDEDEADTFLEGEEQSDRGQHGYHAFAFWSSRYSWLPQNAGHVDVENDTDPPLLSRRLAPHETEIYHIKPVTPNVPQYVGSDLHFSCGKEVHRFEIFAPPDKAEAAASPRSNGTNGASAKVEIQLNPAYNRVGHVFLYLPVTRTEHVRVKVNGQGGKWTVVGNTPQVDRTNGSPRLVGRVIRIMVVVHADESPNDGNIQVHF